MAEQAPQRGARTASTRSGRAGRRSRPEPRAAEARIVEPAQASEVPQAPQRGARSEPQASEVPIWHLRPATPTDAEAIAALAASSLPEAWSVACYREELARHDAHVWLARPEAGAADVAGVLVARRVLDALHVWTLAVGVGWRRRGVASALLRAALEAGAAQGAQRCDLEVRTDNAAARGLYARHGFRAVGRRAHRSPDTPGALLLTRALPGTRAA